MRGRSEKRRITESDTGYTHGFRGIQPRRRASELKLSVKRRYTLSPAPAPRPESPRPAPPAKEHETLYARTPLGVPAERGRSTVGPKI